MFCDYLSCCKKWARCSFTLHERLSWTGSWEWKIYRSMDRLTLSSEHQIWKFHVRQTTGSLRSYEGNCNKNVLCLKLSALQLFHVGHFYKKAEVSVLSLYWCNWFSCREEKNERSSSIKYENFTSLFGRLRQKISPESVPHGQHDYFSSLNQSWYWFVTLSSLYVAVVVGRVRKSKCVSRAACSLE